VDEGKNKLKNKQQQLVPLGGALVFPGVQEAAPAITLDSDLRGTSHKLGMAKQKERWRLSS